MNIRVSDSAAVGDCSHELQPYPHQIGAVQHNGMERERPSRSRAPQNSSSGSIRSPPRQQRSLRVTACRSDRCGSRRAAPATVGLPVGSLLEQDADAHDLGVRRQARLRRILPRLSRLSGGKRCTEKQDPQEAGEQKLHGVTQKEEVRNRRGLGLLCKALRGGSKCIGDCCCHSSTM